MTLVAVKVEAVYADWVEEVTDALLAYIAFGLVRVILLFFIASA